MISTRLVWATVLTAVIAAGCAGPNAPLPAASAVDAKAASVTRRPLDAHVVGTQAASTPSPAPAAASPSPIAVPPDVLYVCVSETAGQRKETAIVFAPNVAALCKRHPEMGPCQYERDLCRRGGGRVFAANGQEITRQVEDEYDRKVLRARFRAN